jgi:site-specific recombinase XerD
MNTKITYRVIYGRVTLKAKGEEGKRVLKLDKNGKAPVVIEAYQNPTRRYFPTGIKLKPNEWDKKKNEVKGNPSYNAIINRQKTALQDFELRFPAIYGRSFTLADFDLMKVEDALHKYKKRPTLSGFMLEQIERDKSKLSYSAYIRYKRTVVYLVEYNEGKQVEFVSLNYTFIDGFDYYLRTVKSLHPNSIRGFHKVVKQYLVRAAHMDLVKASKNPYVLFRLPKQATKREVLYPVEIARLEQLTFTADQQWLEFYRDAFLFSVYSLLRISDVTELKQRHLTLEEQGLIYEKTSKKTRKTNSIHRLSLHDLHKVPGAPSKPEQLLHKYARNDNQPLFRRSHPKLNEHLKTVMSMAGITKNVTFHTARHSGITWLVILGIDLPTIKGLAQHASITTTMEYVHLAEPIICEQLSKIVERTGNGWNNRLFTTSHCAFICQ